jgi:hypothetical protein
MEGLVFPGFAPCPTSQHGYPPTPSARPSTNAIRQSCPPGHIQRPPFVRSGMAMIWTTGSRDFQANGIGCCSTQVLGPSPLADGINGGLLPLSCSFQWVSLVLWAIPTSHAPPEAIKSFHVLFCIVAIKILHIYTLQV